MVPRPRCFRAKDRGKVRFTFHKENSENQDRDHCPEGEVLEFIPNLKISYTCEHKDIAGFPRIIVTWQLEQIGNNKTRVELVHSGFIGTEYEMYDDHKEGWNYFLDRLVIIVTPRWRQKDEIMCINKIVSLTNH